MWLCCNGPASRCSFVMWQMVRLDSGLGFCGPMVLLKRLLLGTHNTIPLMATGNLPQGGGVQCRDEAIPPIPRTESCGLRAVTGKRASSAKQNAHQRYQRHLSVWKPMCSGV